MASAVTFAAWAESLESMNYYEVLRAPPNASPEQIQGAFHDLALRCHPDRFVDDGPDVTRAAATVFKQVVRAYNILRRPQLRQRYNAELRKGNITIDEHAFQEKPKPKLQRALYDLTRDPKAKAYAAKAEALISQRKLEAARIQLVTACQHDPMNEELKKRLDQLYLAIASEPG